MPRKVLISFLGTNAYIPAQYYYAKDKSDISPTVIYIQQAIINLFCKDWDENDMALFVTTDLTIKNNWESKSLRFNPATNENEVEEGKGLKFILESLKNKGDIKFQFENIRIDDGDDEHEIWNIFKAIEQKVKGVNEREEIELYLDITHSFRYLPMLGIVLVSYLSVFFKKIKVRKILYGNYEKGKKDNNESPIIDLTSFVHLQSWTKVANEFVNLGEAKSFEEVSTETNLSTKLGELVKAIRTSRGGNLVYDFDFKTLKEEIQKVKRNESPAQEQMTRIIEKIEKRIEKFDNQEIKNGFEAVDWCLKYDLIPQGYTLLQETIKTWLLNKVVPNQVLNKDYRFLTDIALNDIPKYKDGKFNWDKVKETDTAKIRIVEQMIVEVRKKGDKFLKKYKELTGNGLRNDINHGGFKVDYASPEELAKELRSIFDTIRNLLLP